MLNRCLWSGGTHTVSSKLKWRLARKSRRITTQRVAPSQIFPVWCERENKQMKHWTNEKAVKKITQADLFSPPNLQPFSCDIPNLSAFVLITHELIIQVHFQPLTFLFLLCEIRFTLIKKKKKTTTINTTLETKWLKKTQSDTFIRQNVSLVESMTVSYSDCKTKSRRLTGCRWFSGRKKKTKPNNNLDLWIASFKAILFLKLSGSEPPSPPTRLRKTRSHFRCDGFTRDFLLVLFVPLLFFPVSQRSRAQFLSVGDARRVAASHCKHSQLRRNPEQSRAVPGNTLSHGGSPAASPPARPPACRALEQAVGVAQIMWRMWSAERKKKKKKRGEKKASLGYKKCTYRTRGRARVLRPVWTKRGSCHQISKEAEQRDLKLLHKQSPVMTQFLIFFHLWKKTCSLVLLYIFIYLYIFCLF